MPLAHQHIRQTANRHTKETLESSQLNRDRTVHQNLCGLVTLLPTAFGIKDFLNTLLAEELLYTLYTL